MKKTSDNNTSRRISFGYTDAEHLYELALEHFLDDCYECQDVRRQLEMFLGTEKIKEIKKIIKKNGYCKNIW